MGYAAAAVEVTVRSQGYTTGCTSSTSHCKGRNFFINGVEIAVEKYSSLRSRGIALVVYNPLTNTVEKKLNYDTHWKPDEVAAMVDAINTILIGNIVLLAVGDEGSRKMTSTSWAALESLGYTSEYRFGYQKPYALAAVKGKPTAAVDSVP